MCRRIVKFHGPARRAVPVASAPIPRATPPRPAGHSTESRMSIADPSPRAVDGRPVPARGRRPRPDHACMSEQSNSNHDQPDTQQTEKGYTATEEHTETRTVSTTEQPADSDAD